MTKPIQILLADGQPLIRVGIQTVLSAEPDMMIVAEAVDGHTAQQLSQELQPDVLLLDLRMPKQGGFEALRWIRAMPGVKALPVVVLSSSSLPEDLELATALGATSYIVKPGSYQELSRIVAELLDRFGLTNRKDRPGS